MGEIADNVIVGITAAAPFIFYAIGFWDFDVMVGFYLLSLLAVALSISETLDDLQGEE